MAKTMAIGLMSGTSLDGVDVALIETDGESDINFVKALSIPYCEEFRERLKKVASKNVALNEVLRIEQELTMRHVDAVKLLLEKAKKTYDEIGVVGFHGQTIRHLPEEGLTWQIGNPNLLSELCGIPVVSDFRRRDMACGGQGAPLVPLYHQSLLKKEKKPLAVVNIGGVSNVTWIGKDGEVIASDCGSGVGVLDEWIQLHTGLPFDEDGKISQKGNVDEKVVAKAMKLPFFKRDFPRSADRYEFHKIKVNHLNLEDGAATLCAVTANSILETLSSIGDVKQVLLCGGGAKHPLIIEMLKQGLPQVKFKILNLGKKRADFIEAECFAWLAVRRLKGLPVTLKSTTGANTSTVGGVLTA